MNKIIFVLQWLLQKATAFSVLFYKVPVKLLRLIPGFKQLEEKLDGYKTATANFCVIALSFMEGKDWIDIGTSVCDFINFVLGFFTVNYVCDPSWFGAIAAILTAMLNLALRAATNKPLPAELIPK